MKTIGLIGGMSWESTASYYRAINEGIKDALGGLHSAKLLLYSVDFAEIEQCQHQGDWVTTANILADAASKLQSAGADFILICTNTMHKVAPAIESAVNIPLLHIADATANTLKTAGISKVGLLGTAFTMEEDFYKGRLIEQHGLNVITPNVDDRAIIHRVIYEELCMGNIKPSSRDEFLRIIQQLKSEGAEAVILGCTEIGLLVSDDKSCLPVFDTTEIHAAKAVEMALL